MIPLNPYVIPGLKNMPEIRNYSMTEILDMVSHQVGIEAHLILGKSRKREFVIPRQLAMYFIKNNTSETLGNIGKFFGGRDHTTVIHSVNTIQDLVDTKNPGVLYDYNELRRLFNN